MMWGIFSLSLRLNRSTHYGIIKAEGKEKREPPSVEVI